MVELAPLDAADGSRIIAKIRENWMVKKQMAAAPKLVVADRLFV